ncbi:STM4014 family protein [Paenibacillus senegalensis]|uniref:STM4014 family protein n=1 Tax=Paenibacillus senegalensis TaxID=1465766 RepID=UPI0002884CF4|nr:STM4014 family protein [Paenibacillus senegalensis]
MYGPLVLIGNLHNKRTSGLRRARERFGLPAVIEISYLDLLEGRVTLSDTLLQHGFERDDRILLRLDSPGEQFAVERSLIALGAADASEMPAAPSNPGAPSGLSARREPVESVGPGTPYAGNYLDNKCWAEMSNWLRTAARHSFLSRQEALKLEEQPGYLHHPSQWFHGFSRFLGELEREVTGGWPQARWWNSPSAILHMMDKRLTYRVLTNAGVPVPPRLADPADIPDYVTLCERMLKERMHRVFIKLAVGAGACGVMAFQINPVTGKQLAVTTLNVSSSSTRPNFFFSTKKLQKYEDTPVLQLMIDWLLSHGAQVERWIAKAGRGDQVFDIRQLVVGGRACHSVVRISRSPITNLHLRSKRMSPEEWGLSASVLDEVKQCAEQAVRAFPHANTAGVDVVLSRHANRPYVVDVNPFGDLLYDVTYQGWDTYEWEMKMLCQI